MLYFNRFILAKQKTDFFMYYPVDDDYSCGLPGFAAAEGARQAATTTSGEAAKPCSQARRQDASLNLFRSLSRQPQECEAVGVRLPRKRRNREVWLRTYGRTLKNKKKNYYNNNSI
jgi:hypothetical protein